MIEKINEEDRWTNELENIVGSSYDKKRFEYTDKKEETKKFEPFFDKYGPA